MHKGQEEARERTAQAMERRHEADRRDKSAIADKVVEVLQKAYNARASEATPPVVHWDDCDADHTTFWIHVTAKERDVLEADYYSQNIATTFRSAVSLIKKEIAGPSPYELLFEIVSSPVKQYRPGKGPARFRISGVSQHHWVHKLYIQG